MKTIEYRLRSDPEKSVRVFEEDAAKAEDFMKSVFSGDKRDIAACINYPYLTNPGIYSAFAKLIISEAADLNSLKLKDEIYLRVCIYLNEERHSLEAREFDLPLSDAVLGLRAEH